MHAVKRALFCGAMMAEQSHSQESMTCESEILEPSRDRDKYCPHCQCVVPNTTFYRHKQQFYCEESGQLNILFDLWIHHKLTNFTQSMMAEQSRSQESTTCESEILEPSRDRDKYCPHCQCVVPNTTFYRRKQQFYCEESHLWSNVPLRKWKSNSAKPTRAAQPELQDSTFMDTVESAMSDSTDQTMGQEMYDFTPEGMFNCIDKYTYMWGVESFTNQVPTMRSGK